MSAAHTSSALSRRGGPGRQAPGASSPPCGSGSARATGGAHHFLRRQDGRQAVGQAELLLPGAHRGADLTPQELIPCGRTTGLRKLALPPFVLIQQAQKAALPAPTLPEICQDPQPPGSGRGPSQMSTSSPNRGGARDARCPAGTLIFSHPECRTFFPGHTEGHSWQGQTGLRTQGLVPLPHGSG